MAIQDYELSNTARWEMYLAWNNLVIQIAKIAKIPFELTEEYLDGLGCYFEPDDTLGILENLKKWLVLWENGELSE